MSFYKKKRKVNMFEFTLDTEDPKVTVWDDYVPIISEGRHADFYLTSPIEAPAEYNKLCYVLSKAYKEDTATIHLNNGGGSADSAFMITDAMSKSKAKVTGKLSGMVASASTLITMHCDKIEIAPYTQFMIHNYFHGAQGTGNQVKEYVNFTDKEFTKAVKEIYAGFLTEDEMIEVSTADKEIWMGAEELRKRWDAYKAKDKKALEGIAKARKAK